jgi:excisionase family DNA binding protein
MKGNEVETTVSTLTVQEFCRLYRLSHRGFYDLVKHGTAPVMLRIGRRIRITDQSVRAWEANRVVQAPEVAATSRPSISAVAA